MNQTKANQNVHDNTECCPDQSSLNAVANLESSKAKYANLRKDFMSTRCEVCRDNGYITLKCGVNKDRDAYIDNSKCCPDQLSIHSVSQLATTKAKYTNLLQHFMNERCKDCSASAFISLSCSQKRDMEPKCSR